MIYAGKIETRSVEYGDHLARRRAKKVLVTLRKSVHAEAVGGLRQERLRLHFGINRLAEDFIEGQAKEEGTQVVDVGDAAEAVEIPSGVQAGVFATFFKWRCANAAVNHPEIIQISIRSCGGPDPKLASLRSSPEGKILRTHSGIHHAVDGPIVGIAHHVAVRGRVSD